MRREGDRASDTSFYCMYSAAQITIDATTSSIGGRLICRLMLDLEAPSNYDRRSCNVPGEDNL